MPAPILTQSTLKELLYYSPETGVFIWLTRDLCWFRSSGYQKRWNDRYGGEKAGAINPQGYVSIKLNGRSYLAHRLAFLYMTGEMPIAIDHVNHNRENNKWANLSPANYEINSHNRSISSNNTSGFNGVYWNKKQGKWIASLGRGLNYRYLGCYANKLDAIEARKEANNKHSFHINHGL